MTMIVSNAVKDPRIPNLLTITKITLSKDMHYCHVYFTVLSEHSTKIDTIIEGLNSAKGYIQKNIGDKLQLRFTPKIEFRHDQEQAKADNVDSILEKLTKERLDKESK